jgi:hypothetical protein
VDDGPPDQAAHIEAATAYRNLALLQVRLSSQAMARPEAKSLRRPEQVRRFPNGRVETVSHNETTIGRFSMEPGWRWSRDVGPIAQTRTCQIHHQGVVLKGRLRVESETGEVCEFEVDDVYDIPPNKASIRRYARAPTARRARQFTKGESICEKASVRMRPPDHSGDDARRMYADLLRLGFPHNLIPAGFSNPHFEQRNYTHPRQ